MTMLFDEKAVRKRMDTSVYGSMRERAKPKLWKTGKRKGQVKVPGIYELPFTRQQLWDYAYAKIGPGAVACPYCVAIERPVTMIDLISCVFDHLVPLAHGGTWDLSNLIPVCADCNNCKGKFSYDFFIGIMTALEKWKDPRDRAMMHACMRTHGVVQRLKGFFKKPRDEGKTLPPPAKQLALEEEF